MHTPPRFFAAIILGLCLTTASEAATKEIRYDEGGRLLDPLPALKAGDTLRVRVQIADPEIALQVVHQVRYTCGGNLKTAKAPQFDENAEQIDVFDDGAKFDIPVGQNCAQGISQLTWHLDVASRDNHAERLHLHKTIRLLQSLYKVSTSPEMSRRKASAHAIVKELTVLEENRKKRFPKSETLTTMVMNKTGLFEIALEGDNWTLLAETVVNAFGNYTARADETETLKAEYKVLPELSEEQQAQLDALNTPHYTQLPLPWYNIARGETRVGAMVYVINRQADSLAEFQMGSPSDRQHLFLAIGNATSPWTFSKAIEVAQLQSEHNLDTDLLKSFLGVALGPAGAFLQSRSASDSTMPEINLVIGEPRYTVSILRLGRFNGETRVSYTAQADGSAGETATLSGTVDVRKARRFGIRAGLLWGEKTDVVTGIRTASNGETLFLNGQPQLEVEASDPRLGDQLGALLGVAYYLQPTVPGQESLTGWSSLKPYLLFGATVSEFQFTLDGLKNSLNDDLYVGLGLGAGARFGLTAGVSLAPRNQAVLNDSGKGWELDERYGATGFFVSLNADLQMARAFLGVRDSLQIGLHANNEQTTTEPATETTP
jgi:hypothetical protein